jgi:hypothetical protein
VSAKKPSRILFMFLSPLVALMRKAQQALDEPSFAPLESRAEPGT